jgi:putative transposase
LRQAQSSPGLWSVLELEDSPRPARPAGVPKEIRELIRTMSRENPLWGAPHIHGELLKLGVDVGETSVGKYMVSHRKPPSQTWRTFLDNHLTTLVSVDFLTVPTIRFQILYVFLVLAHERRRIVHLAVTPHPTAEWTAQQLREAFPWETAPRYLLRDRDRIFGQDFVAQVKAMGIKQVLSAPRSPWQRAYVERVIGTIRRECLDHMIVFHERSLYRYLQDFLKYYHQNRTHLALEKDSPEPRPVQPPKSGRIVSIPVLGGLHHRLRTARSIRPTVLMIHLSGLKVDKPAILRWPITDVVKDSSSTDPQSTLPSRRTPTPNARSR